MSTQDYRFTIWLLRLPSGSILCELVPWLFFCNGSSQWGFPIYGCPLLRRHTSVSAPSWSTPVRVFCHRALRHCMAVTHTHTIALPLCGVAAAAVANQAGGVAKGRVDALGLGMRPRRKHGRVTRGQGSEFLPNSVADFDEIRLRFGPTLSCMPRSCTGSVLEGCWGNVACARCARHLRHLRRLWTGCQQTQGRSTPCREKPCESRSSRQESQRNRRSDKTKGCRRLHTPRSRPQSARVKWSTQSNRCRPRIRPQSTCSRPQSGRPRNRRTNPATSESMAHISADLAAMRRSDATRNRGGTAIGQADANAVGLGCAKGPEDSGPIVVDCR